MNCSKDQETTNIFFMIIEYIFHNNVVTYNELISIKK
jgi:hypothetical protein